MTKIEGSQTCRYARFGVNPSVQQKNGGWPGLLYSSRWLSVHSVTPWLIFLTLLVSSCKKYKPEEPEVPSAYSNGVLVLNEGLFQQNNSSMTWYAKGTDETFQGVFQSVNGRGLGDTANDMEFYSLGGNNYVIIAVDVSSQIEIINADNLESVAQIPLFNGETAREPRRIAVYGNKAFVACFDGTVAVIDLNNYAVTSIIGVGANPDGIVEAGGFIYVTNSGGLESPVYDSTISVINPTSLVVSSTLPSKINCTEIVCSDEGFLYVLAAGNYSDIDPSLIKIDPTTEAVVTTFDLSIAAMEKGENNELYYYNRADEKIYVMSLSAEVSTVLIDCSGYDTFYDLEIDASNNLIYTMDANGYVNSSTVRCYDLNGNFQFEFTAGLNATEMVFL